MSMIWALRGSSLLVSLPREANSCFLSPVIALTPPLRARIIRYSEESPMSAPGDATPRPPNPHRPPPEVIREFNDRGLQWLFEDPQNVRGALQLVAPELAALLD